MHLGSFCSHPNGPRNPDDPSVPVFASGLCSMWIVVLLPTILSGCTTIHRYPFNLLLWEKHCEDSVSCPRTKHNGSGQQDLSIQRVRLLVWAQTTWCTPSTLNSKLCSTTITQKSLWTFCYSTLEKATACDRTTYMRTAINQNMPYPAQQKHHCTKDTIAKNAVQLVLVEKRQPVHTVLQWKEPRNEEKKNFCFFMISKMLLSCSRLIINNLFSTRLRIFFFREDRCEFHHIKTLKKPTIIYW